MKLPNFHTHTEYCDGKGSVEDYIKQALDLKQPAIGFTGHAPVPFDSEWNMTEENFKKYLADITHAKEKYKSEIEVYIGLEVDYIRSVQKPSDFKKYNLNYIIGSVHYLYPSTAEKPYDFVISPAVFKETLRKVYGGNIKKMIKDYYSQVNAMIESGDFEIIGHLDQMSKFNKGDAFFDDLDVSYQNTVIETLELIAQNGLILEINTRGKLKKQLENFFPSTKIINESKKRGIPFMLNADAHKPEELNSLMSEAAQYLYDLGVKELVVIEKGEFVSKGITSFIKGKQ